VIDEWIFLRDGKLHDRGNSPREWRECAPRAATFWSRPVATRPTTCGGLSTA
jgi:hypothetical protein